MTEPADLVQSVSRALRLLEEVGRSDRPLPVKVLARRAGLNLSTTYHLVRTLAYEGYLDRTAEGDYVIGSEVARRYRDLVGALRGAPEATAVLSHLAATTGHSAYLGRFVDGRMLVTALVEGPASPYLEDLEVGLPWAGHATAAGKALLATLPHQARRAYLGGPSLRPFTARTTTDPEQLEADLAEVRPGRTVVEHGEFREGVSCAAALVRRDDPAEPWWAVVVSARAPAVPAPVERSVLLAASDLASAPPSQ